MSILIFDTETTGLQKKHAPIDMQPHVVQLAAVLVTPEGRIVSEINHIIKPEGWDIPQESIAVHGITMDIAMKYGLSRQAVLIMFSNLVKRADILVAHNAPFDLQMINQEYNRQGAGSPLFDKEVYCTAENSTNVLKLPPTQRMKECGYGDCFKKPNLKELHEFLFYWWDESAAHDAMGDVKACMRCYFKLKGLDIPEKAKRYDEDQLRVYGLLHEWMKVSHPDELREIIA